MDGSTLLGTTEEVCQKVGPEQGRSLPTMFWAPTSTCTQNDVVKAQLNGRGPAPARRSGWCARGPQAAPERATHSPLSGIHKVPFMGAREWRITPSIEMSRSEGRSSRSSSRWKRLRGLDVAGEVPFHAPLLLDGPLSLPAGPRSRSGHVLLLLRRRPTLPGALPFGDERSVGVLALRQAGLELGYPGGLARVFLDPRRARRSWSTVSASSSPRASCTFPTP